MQRKFILTILSLATLQLLDACNGPSELSATSQEPATPVINWSVVKTFPHDTALYTEGLLFHNGKLFESTGSPDELPQTKSMIGISDLMSGKFEPKITINRDKYFGEGIVFFNGKLYQLTYTTQVCFRYDEKNFKLIDSFHYRNAQGWSLTSNGKELIMNDATDTLSFLNPENLKTVRTIKITENGSPLYETNEMEFINGFIYANIYQTNFIVKIDPSSGKVVGKLDLSTLVQEAKSRYPNAEVLNGIAFDSANNKIYVTGKFWPNIYEIFFPH